MKTAKLGALFLVSVMALAGVGAGYAAWTDTITIEGTVNTGTVDVVIGGLSGTDVYKDLFDDSCDIRYYLTDVDGNLIHEYWVDTGPPEDGLLVASATAEKTADDEVTFTFDGLFPEICFMADAKLHYVGSIPVKINDVDIDITSGEDWILNLISSGDIYAALFEWDPATHTIGREVCEGYQMHECQWLVVVLFINIPQDDIYMGVTGSATVTIEFVQWNEYPYGP